MTARTPLWRRIIVRSLLRIIRMVSQRGAVYSREIGAVSESFTLTLDGKVISEAMRRRAVDST